MRMNSVLPAPSSKKRGPRPLVGGITRVTTASAPLAVLFSSRSATCRARIDANLSSGIGGPLQPCGKLCEHVGHHPLGVVSRGPIPLAARGAVIQTPRPGVRNALSDRIDLIVDLERGDVLTNQLGKRSRCQLH